MSWIDLLSHAGTALVGAGLLASANKWLKARAHHESADARHSKAKAARELAEAKVLESEAAMDAAIASQLAHLQAEMKKCESERQEDRKRCELELAAQRRWVNDQIGEMQRKLDRIQDNTGRHEVPR